MFQVPQGLHSSPHLVLLGFLTEGVEWYCGILLWS